METKESLYFCSSIPEGLSTSWKQRHVNVHRGQSVRTMKEGRVPHHNRPQGKNAGQRQKVVLTFKEPSLGMYVPSQAPPHKCAQKAPLPKNQVLKIWPYLGQLRFKPWHRHRRWVSKPPFLHEIQHPHLTLGRQGWNQPQNTEAPGGGSQHPDPSISLQTEATFLDPSVMGNFSQSQSA